MITAITTLARVTAITPSQGAELERVSQPGLNDRSGPGGQRRTSFNTIQRPSEWGLSSHGNEDQGC